MVIGVLGGSFCPPTIAHMELSKACINQGLCDKVIWVPVNEAYRKSTNIAVHHRVAMVALAIGYDSDVSFSLHEVEREEVVYTINSLKILQTFHPNDRLMFIAGADKMEYKWFRREEIIRDFGYIISNRDGIDCESIIQKSENLSKYRNNIKFVDYHSDISSTIVRDQILQTGTSALIHPDVLKYIQETNCFS